MKLSTLIRPTLFGLICFLFSFSNAQSQDPKQVCTAAYVQRNTIVLNDASGGQFYVWLDQRDAFNASDVSAWNIYAQDTDSTGAFMWGNNGKPVFADGQWTLSQIAALSDGAGGLFIIGRDQNASNYTLEVRAQHLDANGGKSWGDNGIVINHSGTGSGDPTSEYTGLDMLPLTSDGSGGFIVAWPWGNGASNSISLQRVDGTGAIKWTEVILAPSSTPGSNVKPVLTSDGSGGAFVAYVFGTNLTQTSTALIQHVDSNGNIWGSWPQGEILGSAFAPNFRSAIEATGTLPPYLDIVPSSNGSALVFWADGTGAWNAQSVANNGTFSWTPAKSISSAHSPAGTLSATSDGRGGAIIVLNEGENRLLANRVGANGDFIWVNFDTLSASSGLRKPITISDSSGGAYTSWADTSGNPYANLHPSFWPNSLLYVQHMDSSGHLQWVADTSDHTSNKGRLVANQAWGFSQIGSTGTDAQGANRRTNYMINTNIAGNSRNVTVAWPDASSTHSATGVDIYAQRINNPDGSLGWITPTPTPTPISISVALSTSAASMPESGGSVTVTATLNNASTSSVTVELGFTGSATKDTNYTASGTEITIPAGQTTGAITLTAVDDNTYYATNKTALLAITGATGATYDPNASISVTILESLAVQAMSVPEGWSLVSSPLAGKDPTGRSNFGPATSAGFSYKGNYSVVDTFKNGTGYWFKYPFASTWTDTGKVILADTVDVQKRWNMIGSVSYPVPVSSIVGDSETVTSDFYGYNGTGYNKCDILQPGSGYWVKVSRNGKLYITGSPGAKMLGKTAIRVDHSDTEPPPPPPSGFVYQPKMPKDFALDQNYPNPFNPTTKIGYQLPVDGLVTLKIYNITGQVVQTLLRGDPETKGFKSVDFNAGSLASGVYLYRLQVGKFEQVRKMLLIK